MSALDQNHLELIEQLNEDAARLIEHLRSSHAPVAVINEASGHIQKALDVLAPSLQQGEGWSTVSIAGDMPGIAWADDDITACMPYSPISGRRNPVAPPIKMWKSNDSEVSGEVVFSPTYAGPPDAVHGGMIAAVFDELLAMANVITGRAGFTATLTIRYKAKTPLNTPIELWALNEVNEGRKQISRAEMRVDGKVTASAEGLFICADDLQKTPEEALITGEDS